jgi:transposase
MPEQCVCQGCGKETVVIGDEDSSQLDVEPAEYFVLISKREKRACKSCEEQSVVSLRSRRPRKVILPPRCAVVIGIAPWTTKRALTSNLNRE